MPTTGQSPHHPVPHELPKEPAVLEAAARLPAELVSVPPSSTTPHTSRHPEMGTDPRHGRGSAPPVLKTGGEMLLRKEVIQPHLPVRLPCYVFVPIADPAFDSSLPVRGWATGFGRYRLS